MKKAYFLTLLAIGLTLAGCEQQQPEGPYFGNGFHNGWADSHSIKIWTRLTVNKEMNLGGAAFLIPDRDAFMGLAASTDVKAIAKAQIPNGKTLADMEGACPGAAGQVQLSYHPVDKPNETVQLPWADVDTTINFTKQWALDDLVAGTKYKVTIEARKSDGAAVSDVVEGMFSTAPNADQVEELEFCMTTCHDYRRRDDSVGGHKIYKSMLQHDPDFYIHHGDIEYYDGPSPYAFTEELMYFKWDRLFALPFQRDFYNKHTTYFMKDDHDVLRDDAFPGSTFGTVSFERGLEIFDKEQFPANDKPYKAVRWGKDLQLIIVEGRNYRSKNTDDDGPDKTIWGEEQKEWVFKTIETSDATYKLLISSSPILGPDRKNKKDNYSNSNFQYEGDAIRAFINGRDDVIIVTGDRHWQYVTHFEGTNLWEFSTGAGADQHAGGWSNDKRFPQHQYLNVIGGYLSGKLWRENGEVKLKFTHHGVEGNVLNEQEFSKRI